MKCLRCKGDLVTIETGNEQIQTLFCESCGLIENRFYPETRKALREKAVVFYGNEGVKRSK